MTETAHDFDAVDDRSALTAPTAAFRLAVRSDRYPVVPDPVRIAIDARVTLDQAHGELYAGIITPQQASDGLLTALTQGKPLQDALDAALDVHFDHQRRGIAAGLLQRAAGQAERFLRDQITAALPEIMAGLRPQIEETAKILRKAYADAGTLDIDKPDPMEVAQATEKQRSALVTIAEQTKRYRTLRLAQRNALEASSLPIPGNHNLRVTWHWKDLFETGVHEVSAPGRQGLPEKDRAPRYAVRAVVLRSDLWVPDPDQLKDAYEQLQSRIQAEDAEARRLEAAEAQDPWQPNTIRPGVAALLDANTLNNRKA